MTRVKICGIREWEHAEAALSAGADLLGFVFYRPSQRNVTPAEARQIIQRARETFGSAWYAVGLFVNEPPAIMAGVVDECGLDLVQLSGDEERWVGERLPIPFVKVVRPGQLAPRDLPRVANRAYWGAERVLLDAHVDGWYGGTGKPLVWSSLRSVASECLLAGGLRPENVCQAVLEACPWGVDVSSGVELESRKCSDLIRSFIGEVRRADERRTA